MGTYARAEPIRLLGGRPLGPLRRFGLIFTLLILVGQYLMMILPLAPTTSAWRLFLPLLPLTLLRAASNGFNEEVIFRVAPMSPLVDVVGRSHAIWMAAVLFGLAHYIGGIPSGLPGIVLTGMLGLFFGKCLVDSKALFWPWLFHSVQDILPFTLTALVYQS